MRVTGNAVSLRSVQSHTGAIQQQHDQHTSIMVDIKKRRSGGQQTANLRKRTHRARMREAGLVRVEVMVPEGCADEIRAFAEKMKSEREV